MDRYSINAVPAWAHFFSAGQYSRFLQLVMNYFSGQRLSYSFEEGFLLMEGDKRNNSGKIGLLNLAQFCHRHDEKDWPTLITNHFNGLNEAAMFERDFASQAHDFNFAKDHIAVRIYSSKYIGAIEEGLAMGRSLSDDIYAMLVFDFPHSVINVRPEQTLQWPVTNDELFELGLGNVRKKYPSRISKQILDGILFHIVAEDHYYAPNILFDLETMKHIKSDDGLLIGIPNRHTVLIHSVRDRKVLKAANRMIPAIWGMHGEGPGSLSDKIFWLKDGILTDLPYVIDSENILFNPPEIFLRMLALLKEKAH